MKDYFTQNRWINGVLMGIVLLNLVVLASLWLTKRPSNVPEGPRPRNMAVFLQKELDLRPEQMEQIRQFQQQHRRRIRQIERRRHADRRLLFEGINQDEINLARVDSLTYSIGNHQAEMEFLTFDLIRNIRSVCDEEQKQKLSTVFHEILKQMSPPPPGRNRRQPPPRP